MDQTLPPRKIIHIDMDAFFASVEQRDNPEYRGLPLIVGGDPQGRGVVAACSYEARRFGIHSAMPCSRAYRLCPQAIFVRPRFDAYKAVSRQIQAIFNEYTPLVEPLSLDEAYLDVTDCRQCAGSATLIAQEIKRRILAQTGLTASAGVSYNKFLAKTASDVNKPDGLFVILPEQGADFVAELDIGRFYGVGPVTEARMRELGINSGADLRDRSLPELEQAFGKAGHYYHQIARGIDHRSVEPDRPRKSIGAENTFAQDLTDLPAMRVELDSLADQVARLLQARQLAARRVTLKVKYNDFRINTRSQTCPLALSRAAAIAEIAGDLLGRTEAGRQPVRLLGVSVAALQAADDPADPQLPLYRIDMD